jgi:hypothetical protein
VKISKLVYRMAIDKSSKNLVKYKMLIKLPCDKVFIVRTTGAMVAVHQMAGSTYIQAQTIMNNRIADHYKKCGKCQKETKTMMASASKVLRQ